MQSGPKVLTEQSFGVNYRALNDLFHISKERKDTFCYEISVQMIEIYNEQVRDLLASDGPHKRYPFIRSCFCNTSSFVCCLFMIIYTFYALEFPTYFLWTKC